MLISTPKPRRIFARHGNLRFPLSGLHQTKVRNIVTSRMLYDIGAEIVEKYMK
jgi:hypothetical protein